MRTPATLRLNAGDSINRGLVGFWPLNENAGTLARDLTSYRTTGVYERDPAFAVGLLGRTRTFTNAGGTNTKRVNLGTNRPWSSLQIPMTIAAWVKPTSGSGEHTAFSQYSQFDVDGKFGKWLGVVGGNVTATIGKNTAPFYQKFTTGPAVTIGAWGLIAWVLTGSTSSPSLRLYYNNSWVDVSPSALGSVDATVETWIGSSVLASIYPSNEGFAGDIGPVRIWTRALKPNEISRLYSDPWAGTFTPGPRLYSASSPITGTIADTIGITGALSGVVLDPITGTLTDTLDITGSLIGGSGSLGGRLRRRGRYRVWDDVPPEIQPVVSLAENYADAYAVERAVDEAIARMGRLRANASAAKRRALIEDVSRSIVRAVEAAAEADDEEALIALM